MADSLLHFLCVIVWPDHDCSGNNFLPPVIKILVIKRIGETILIKTFAITFWIGRGRPKESVLQKPKWNRLSSRGRRVATSGARSEWWAKGQGTEKTAEADTSSLIWWWRQSAASTTVIVWANILLFVYMHDPLDNFKFRINVNTCVISVCVDKACVGFAEQHHSHQHAM